MKREIKFRAWHTTAHEMLYGDNVSVFRWDEHEHQPIYIMQFTGLKDKNGKEIYESDLLKSHDRDFCKAEEIVAVKWSGSGFVVYSLHCCDVCRNSGGCIGNLDEFPNEWEVVGNIYEDKNLLNE